MEEPKVLQTKYEYEYGLCKRMHYRGLWLVEYQGYPGDRWYEVNGSSFTSVSAVGRS